MVVQLQLFRSRHLDLFRGQCVAEDAGGAIVAGTGSARIFRVLADPEIEVRRLHATNVGQRADRFAVEVYGERAAVFRRIRAGHGRELVSILRGVKRGIEQRIAPAASAVADIEADRSAAIAECCARVALADDDIQVIGSVYRIRNIGTKHHLIGEGVGSVDDLVELMQSYFSLTLSYRIFRKKTSEISTEFL